MTTILTKQQAPYFWQFDQDCFEDISEVYFTAKYWQTHDAVLGKEHGRGTTWFIQHQGAQLVLRHYLRGGMMRHVNNDNYLFNSYQKTRSIAEFTILHTLLKKNLPVPRPAAAQVIKHGLFYQADLLTHKIPDAQDLVQVLHESQSKSFYHQLGKMIAKFHKQGVFHADLNIQNILQDKQGQFWLIDFDRARILTPKVKWQQSTLSRLKRSFEKEQVRFGIKWSEQNWKELLQGYQS